MFSLAYTNSYLIAACICQHRWTSQERIPASPVCCSLGMGSKSNHWYGLHVHRATGRCRRVSQIKYNMTVKLRLCSLYVIAAYTKHFSAWLNIKREDSRVTWYIVRWIGSKSIAAVDCTSTELRLVADVYLNQVQCNCQAEVIYCSSYLVAASTLYLSVNIEIEDWRVTQYVVHWMDSESNHWYGLHVHWATTHCRCVPQTSAV